jgi:hypothetical protein
MTLTLSLNLSTSDDTVAVIYPSGFIYMLQEDAASFVLQEDNSRIIFKLPTD